MGYAGKSLGEARFWIRTIGLSALAALNLADFLSAILASPGFFNLWVIRITIVGSLALGIGASIRNFSDQKKEKEIILSQKQFESRRVQEMSAYVAGHPDFQTPCYLCRHFNREHKGCMREIRNLKAKRMKLGTSFYYCLYWEARDARDPKFNS